MTDEQSLSLSLVEQERDEEFRQQCGLMGWLDVEELFDEILVDLMTGEHHMDIGEC